MISKNNINNHLHKVTNAIILAAGQSKRFYPVSEYCPKGLSIVKGEVLIERQIRQLKEVGITDITVVVGYKKELFYYLSDKFNITIIENNLYDIQDNISSLRLVVDKLENTYICSVDNYYPINLFQKYERISFYSTVYVPYHTDEWVVKTDTEGYINDVQIGGEKGNVMLGFVYFDSTFSREFKQILRDVENIDEYNYHVWEYLYMKHLSRLKLTIKVFNQGEILEFDTIDDVVAFDGAFLQSNSKVQFLERI